MAPTNGWGEWKNYMLMAINEIKDTQKEQRKDHVEMMKAIAVLKNENKYSVKNNILWGLIGGILPAIVAVIYLFINKPK